MTGLLPRRRRNAPAPQDGRAGPSILQSSVVYSAGRILRMSVGFFTWVVAARLYSSTQVGIAASVLSTVMLCGLVGTLGVDLALVSVFPDYRDRPTSLINTAITIAMITCAVAGILVVTIAFAGFRPLHVLTDGPAEVALFMALTVLGGAWWIIDQAAVAIRRSDHVLERAILDGGLTVTGVALFGLVGSKSAGSILAAWVIAAVAVCTMGLIQLSRSISGYRFRPHLDRPQAGMLLRLGLPNLTVSAMDSVPGLVFPLIAASTLGVKHAAYWYAVWMMAVGAYQISFSFGLHLFAEIADDRAAFRTSIRQSLRSGFGVSVLAALGLVVIGPYVLRILGAEYADQGTTALRLAAITALPMVLNRSYVFACRARGMIAEGGIVTAISGGSALVLATVGARHFHLTGIAGAWLLTQSIAAVWAAWRLHQLTSGPSDDVSTTAPAGLPGSG